MEDVIVPLAAFFTLFIGMPWLILHHVTKWKSSAVVMTDTDEKLLDDLYNSARRLEERLETVERIIAADHPNFRSLPEATRGSTDPLSPSAYSRSN